MNAVLVIAANTAREVIRQRLFGNTLLFGVLMVLLSVVVSNITFGRVERVVRSIGLGGVALASGLLALLVGVTLIHREIERRTLFVVLTRPVSRAQYVLGRYLGFLVTLAAVTLSFALVFFLCLGSVGAAPTVQDAHALTLSFVQASVLAAFAVVLSSFSTPTVAAGTGLGFWIACASTDDLVNLTAQAEEPVRSFAVGLAYILPSFARFNLADAAVHDDPVSWLHLAWTTGYGALYVVLFVALAGVVLARREMT